MGTDTIKAAISNPVIPMAVVLDGVSEQWGINVLQILARPSSAEVTVDGYGTVAAPALVLSKGQALELARQIIELVG
jgi:hypothetical protein